MVTKEDATGEDSKKLNPSEELTEEEVASVHGGVGPVERITNVRGNAADIRPVPGHPIQ